MNAEDLNKIFDELESHARDIKGLSVQLAEKEQKIQTLEREIRRLRMDNDILNQNYAQLEETYKTWQERVRSLLTKMD